MKGAPASRARRREISVLPTPVGPIIRMFFGSTSSRSLSSSCSRRQRLRSAIATARLASPWPTMKRSSSETISRGEKSVIACAIPFKLSAGKHRSVRQIDGVALVAGVVRAQRQHRAFIEFKRQDLVFSGLQLDHTTVHQRQNPRAKRDDDFLIVDLGASQRTEFHPALDGDATRLVVEQQSDAEFPDRNAGQFRALEALKIGQRSR